MGTEVPKDESVNVKLTFRKVYLEESIKLKGIEPGILTSKVSHCFVLLFNPNKSALDSPVVPGLSKLYSRLFHQAAGPTFFDSIVPSSST